MADFTKLRTGIGQAYSFYRGGCLSTDKRRLQRFRIGVPAHIEARSGLAQSIHMDLLSRDVCADGAFFLTTRPLDIDTRVWVKMQLIPRKLAGNRGKRAQITITGTVLRADASGMAIRFNPNYQMSPLAPA
jgi:hypothetical protein